MTTSPSPTPLKFADVYAELGSNSGLSEVTTRAVFDAIFAGLWTPAQIAAFLVAARARETAALASVRPGKEQWQLPATGAF